MTKTVLLNGFDRCGSSMISRMLAEHPEIELIFQPFNSTNIRRRMYEMWDDGTAEPQDIRFLDGMRRGRLAEDYIVSHWHANFSSTRVMVPGHLHVVKTTLNHLTARWMRERFSEIGMWAIWRDPLAILSSVLRNGFFADWYGEGAVHAMAVTAREHPTEFGAYSELAPDLRSDWQKTAYLIGARSYFLFRHVAPEDILVYERVRSDPSAELGRLVERFDLAPFDFSGLVRRDYNVVGEGFREGRAAPTLPPEDREPVRELLAPLTELARARLGIGFRGEMDG